MDVIYVSYSYRCNKTLMKDKFYSRVAVMIMTVIWQMVSITALAQRQVQVVEMQTQPDGTQIYVPKTIEVPEKSSEEVAAAKSKAATVTAEDDDLQYYLNHLPMTRAGESAIVIDLSTFKDTIRQTTLVVNQGISLKFTNGAIRRGEGIARGESLIKISNGSVVEFDESVTISGENLVTNGTAVEVTDASLRTAAWIGNTQLGTENRYSPDIYASEPSSKLEVVGGIIENSIYYYGQEPIIFRSCSVPALFHYSSSDVIFDGETVDFNQYTPKYNNSRVSTKSPITRYRIYDYNNVLGDGVTLMHGADGYQLTSSDVDKLGISLPSSSPLTISDYEKRLEGDSIVLRKKVKDLQSDINNAPDNTETTINLDNYGELTKGILIPKGKKIKMTGTKNVTLASNFTGDYIFRTEGDAQLDITIPGFSGYSSTSLPKYGFVAGYASSKIQVNQLGTNTLSLPNILLAVEKGATIDCYANISTKEIYIAPGGKMNIYSENGDVETFTDEGGTVNITGLVKFNETFTSLGNTSLLSENITSLKELILGKYNNITFTNKWVKPVALNISFKDNDYFLDRTYIKFVSSTTMFSGFETVKFSLQSEHSAHLSGYNLCIEEVDEYALRDLEKKYDALKEDIQKSSENLSYMRKLVDDYHQKGFMTEDEYADFIKQIAIIEPYIVEINEALNACERLRPVFYGKNSVLECEKYAAEIEMELSRRQTEIAKLQSDLDATLASHKKTFTNTDDLQDFLNNLGKNNETTEDNPATVTIADGTVLDNFEIPEGTHVEMNVEGDSNDDLQAFINGLVTVKYGSSLRLNGNYVVRGENTSATLLVHGTIDIYATIILEGTKTEVVHIYNGGTANWRGNMTSGKIVNEGTLNIYSGTTHYIENHGTVHHNTGVCHHIVNYRTYYMKGGNINASNTEYDNAFENCGTAYLTGGTIVSSKTLIINYVNSKTYIDGVKLDDSNATSTIISYSDFHIRGDYSPKHIILDRGVRINFTSVWTVRWHITFIDNRTTIRKVIFHSDKFNLNNDYIKLIDFNLPDGYRWYYNAEEKGIEMRDSKVYDSDDLQAFLDRLAKFAGTASEPVILEGDNHTIDVETDADRLFELPANSYVEIRNVIFRIVSDVSQKRWHIPSGSTLILNNVTLNAGEEEEDDDRAELAVEGGKLYINNVVFINIRLTLNGTVYVCSPLSSRIYLSYENNDEIVNGVHVAEGCNGYVLTEEDLDKFVYCDLDDSSDIWKFLLAENAIELYQEVSGMEKVSGDNHPQIYADEAGRLNIIGVPQDAQCFIYNSEGILIRKGTVSEITASGSIPAKGCYVLKVGKTAMKFVR